MTTEGLLATPSDSQKNSLLELVEHFNRYISDYKYSHYDEANTRVDFIDRFFEILDWDVRNLQGYAEKYRDVVREDKVKIKGKLKAPDYSFRVGGTRKFFVEAKKPSVNIRDDSEPAYQLRRYSYTARLPLSVLTDFEEIALYDTRIRPKPNDSPTIARVFYCSYSELFSQCIAAEGLTNFEYLFNILSKTAVLRGSFDAFVEFQGGARGTTTVDEDFLRTLETWREWIGKGLIKCNPSLPDWKLSLSIQILLDRLLFVRIAEDRNIETYGSLKAVVSSPNIATVLRERFSSANQRFNSDLFADRQWFDSLIIPDKAIAQTVTDMYYPASPYEFSVMPVEILGLAYERFLGKTVRVRGSKFGSTIIIEDKPEVRKAGGVFYTPSRIVDHMVNAILSNFGENLLLDQETNIRFLDPACGSGSFLVALYEQLLDRYLALYEIAQNRARYIKQGRIYQYLPNSFKLTFAEKKRILVTHVFGVDIDVQAIEVTKLALQLKLLEDEQIETRNDLFTHSELSLLPDLSSNIRCGNSLVDSSYYRQATLPLLDDDDMRRINAFDWDSEFPDVFKNGGFDAIIGNPPYGAIFSDDEKLFLRENYNTYEYQLNSFSLFIERSTVLLREKGVLSFITPAVFLGQHYFFKLRSHILNHFLVEKLQVLHFKVFEEADTGDTAIFLLRKSENDKQRDTGTTEYIDITSFANLDKGEVQSLRQTVFSSNTRLEMLASSGDPLIKRVTEASVPLGRIAYCTMGIKPYQKNKGIPRQTDNVVKNRPFDSSQPDDETYKPYLIGKDIDRWLIRPTEIRFIKYGKWLAEPRLKAPFERIKIVVRQTADRIRGCIDYHSRYNLNNVYNIEVLNPYYSPEFVLGLLNSTFMEYVYQKLVPEKQRLFAEIKKNNLEKLPIWNLENQSENDKQVVESITLLVIHLMELSAKDSDSMTENEIKNWEFRIKSAEAQLNDQVYKLYGLSEAEKNIVRESTA